MFAYVFLEVSTEFLYMNYWEHMAFWGESQKIHLSLLIAKGDGYKMQKGAGMYLQWTLDRCDSPDNLLIERALTFWFIYIPLLWYKELNSGQIAGVVCGPGDPCLCVFKGKDVV